jgi:hypothetical protein
VELDRDAAAGGENRHYLRGMTRAAKVLRLLDAPAAEETHIVADDSDDPEHVDDCPGCEAFTLTGHVVD